MQAQEPLSLIQKQITRGAMELRVLGAPGEDNAVLMTLRPGDTVTRLLFDCGSRCLDTVAFRDLQQIDAVLFSHFHMDHVSGFDDFLRANFAREKPVHLFGPRGSHAILAHRLQGFLWDLVAGTPGRFLITEIDRAGLRTIELRSTEGFAVAHPREPAPFEGRVFENEALTVDAVILDHGPSDSIGYVVRQKARVNVDVAGMKRVGLAPGPWVRRLLDGESADGALLEIGGRSHELGALRRELLTTTPGESFGYLTDFRRTPPSDAELVRLFSGCGRLVCENNYPDGDAEIAARNNHMTSSEVGSLASLLAPESLIVFHLTDKHGREGWTEQLTQVRAHFPRAAFPAEWQAFCALTA